MWRTLVDLYENASIGIYRSTRDGLPVFANPAFVQMMGYDTEHEWLSAVRNIEQEWYVDPARRQDFLNEIEKSGHVANFDSEVFVHRTGEKIWVSETARAIKDEAGNTQFFEGTIEDITARKRLESELLQSRNLAQSMALTDPGTGLPNRRALQTYLDMKRADSRHFGVATFVVRRFTDIQSAIGYAEAGELIKAIAGRIETLLPDASVARIDHKTLATVINLEDIEEAVESINAVVYGCAQPVQIQSGAVDVQLVAGLSATESPHGISQIDQARIATRQAVKADTALGVFDPKSHGDPSQTLSMMTEMIDAMQSGDAYVAFQPKVDIRNGTISGFEALVRWDHPERGPIPPNVFVPIAEKTGRISVLTKWVLEQVIAAQTAFGQAGLPTRVAVNMSGRLIDNPRFAADTLRLIRASQSDLCFEITETAVINNPRRAIKAITQLRDEGVSISIDDYGTGLSSLSYLKQIPADELKIDRLFISDLLTKESDQLLVRSTVDLAHALGLRVVAEGIEDAETLGMVRKLGVDKVQGYYISKAKPLSFWLGEGRALLDAYQSRGETSPSAKTSSAA
ncbi:MAG: EAL domain-containing protein [Pseudomonadota bacterium]